MKLKKLLSLKLVMSLLMISINATAINKKDETLIIKAGQSANFSGYLVPEWQFKKINEELLEKDLLKKQIEAPVLKEESSPITTFIWGFLAGSTTVFLAEKLGGK